MNLIVYNREQNTDKEFLEYLRLRTSANIITANSKEDIVKTFMEYSEISKVIILNIMLRPDIGIIKYIKDHYPETKMIGYSSSAVKEIIDVIRNADIEIMDNNFENLKKVDDLINEN